MIEDRDGVLQQALDGNWDAMKALSEVRQHLGALLNLTSGALVERPRTYERIDVLASEGEMERQDCIRWFATLGRTLGDDYDSLFKRRSW